MTLAVAEALRFLSGLRLLIGWSVTEQIGIPIRTGSENQFPEPGSYFQKINIIY